MSLILLPIPSRDFDPTEVAVSWKILTRRGHRVVFATPDGKPGACDPIMLSGIGLDPWSGIPVLRNVRVLGLLLGANADARNAYAEMLRDPAFKSPMRWDQIEFQGLRRPAARRRAPGAGHARIFRKQRSSADHRPVLRRRKAGGCNLPWRAAGRPEQAYRRAGPCCMTEKLRRCLGHWNARAARSRISAASGIRNYYRTYTEAAGQPAGYMSVQQEVTRALASPADFIDVPKSDPDFKRKTSGTARDTETDERPAWVVRDDNYVSARWPGDAHSFARTYAAVLEAGASRDRKAGAA